MTAPNTITAEDIERLIERSKWHDAKLGTKTTSLTMTLPCGFEVTATSACVDPANYDHTIGLSVCRDRIRTKLWELEGYRLQLERFELETTPKARPPRP